MAGRAIQVVRQRDWSAGELVEYAYRRDDDERQRTGARQMSNWRLLTTGTPENRPGRRALFPAVGRVDNFDADDENTFRLCFGDGTFIIRDIDGAIVLSRAGMPWSSATAWQVTWAPVNRDIVVCFAGMRPAIARWNEDDTWSLMPFVFDRGPDDIEKVPYYRVAKKGVTMTPSAVSGTIDIEFSADVLTVDHIGSLLRWANRRMRIKTMVDAQNGTAEVLEELLPCQRLTVAAGAENTYSVGDAVVGSITEAEGVVVEIDTTNHYVFVQLLNVKNGFTTSDTLIGPTQRADITAQTFTAIPLKATTVWEEQVFGDAYGWPQSCTADVSRLIFCDVPALPQALCESAIGLPYDFDVNTLASSAIVELMTGKPRIYHVVGGSDQFLFTSKGVFYIPISEANPLRPGSVTFRKITRDAASQVRPVESAEGILWVNKGRTRVLAILPTGQTSQPYSSRDLSEWNSHLIRSPIGLAVSTGDGQFSERYAYVVNEDGSVVIGRAPSGKDWVGWLPWRPANDGTFTWVSSEGGNTLLTTEYGGLSLCEQVDIDAYLDAQVAINDVPAAMQSQTDADMAYFSGGAASLVGDLISGGGLTAAADGTTSKVAADGAQRSGTTGFFGLALSTAQKVKSATLYPSSDQGFADGTPTLSFQLRAANVPPNSDGSNGFLLGAQLNADITTGSITVSSSNEEDEFLWVWVRITGASSTVYLAQATFLAPGEMHVAPGGGAGDLWMFAGETIKLQKGLMPLGDRQVDATGAIVPAEGDELDAEDIVAGFGWTALLEPFMPHANEGQSVGQTIKRRAVKAGRAAVQKSTGFVVAGHRQAAWKVGENQTVAPPQREEVVEFNVKGSQYDPRVELMKDTPGTLRVGELSFEIEV